MDLQLSARNADINEVLDLLNKQQDVKYDVVVPPTHLRYQGGNLVVKDGAVDLSDDGVGLVDATLAPTANFERNAAFRLDVPYPYIDRMRGAGALELLDHNINHWLGQYNKNLLVRGFRTDDTNDTGIARALLSDRFIAIDNLDAAFAALDGIKDAGVKDLTFNRSDLSETRLRLTMTSPTLLMHTPNFLEGYRSPNGGYGRDYPVIAAGIAIDNSETGGGAFTIAPWFQILVCSNGMTRRQDALRKVHIGTQLEAGVVQWSSGTRQLNIDMIRSQAKDAVVTFLSRDYLNTVEAELEGAAGKVLAKPQEAIEQIGKALRYTETERASILDFFIQGSQPTAGGLMQAVTAYAQTVEDPDRAITFEDDAFDVLARALTMAG
jgi:hypothetical protein